jgi:DNA-binding NtrC family response regulator
MSDHEPPIPSRVVNTPDPLTPPTGVAGTDPPEAVDGEAQSHAMRELFVKAQRVASSDLAILVTGETGVGKGRLARWLHAQSRRALRTFVPVNCGSIPDMLLDTHLFGHAGAAFTDAPESLGIFEAASGGTLFLDHIGESSPAMQVRLLHARSAAGTTGWRMASSAYRCSYCGRD